MPLNPAQLAAVRHVEGPLLVLAGAGSGKTRVITAKIGHLLTRAGYAPEQVFAVTFTNRAAREMHTRLGEAAGSAAERVSVSTFHRLGLRILREHTRAAGLRAGFTLFDATDSDGVLRELVRPRLGPSADHAAVTRELRTLAPIVSAWKSALVAPATAAEHASGPRERAAAALYTAYEAHLEACNAVDFDDLILRPVRLLQSDAEVRALWQARARYLLVDEYQDSNGVQYALLRLLAGERGTFTVVGDDDQSIYAWRGARPENLHDLARDFPALEVVKLEQNYRSRGHILRAANGVIAHNPHLFDKRLWSERGPGEPVRIVVTDDDEAEADRIASEIVDRRLRGRGRYGECAVIYRSNHQSRLVELRLQALRVPYKVSGSASFFDRSEVRDVVAYLRLLVNPDDAGAFLRVINTPRREIGTATIQRLQALATARRTSMLRAADDSELAASVNGRPLRQLRAFAAQVRRHRERLREPAAALRDMLAEIDYAGWLQKQSGDRDRARARQSNVEALLDGLQRRSAEGDSPEDAVRSLVLQELLDREPDETDDDQVQLLTLHAAKGLEFPHVYLLGVEEGLLPHRNSVSDEQLCEERRLTYVGLTRAMETLTLTLTRYRRQRGEKVASEPSRFLGELPEAHVRWEGREDIPQAEREQRARAHIADLKNLLAEG